MEEKVQEIRYRKCSYDELEPSDKELVDAARNATSSSYSPYSKFKVGAAVRLSDGDISTGSNQENAAYPSGLCAERTALFAAGAQHPDQAVTALAIAAFNNGHWLSSPITPCGACRQVIAETESRYGLPVRIILYGHDYCLIFEDGISPLLPFCFGTDTLSAK